MDMKKILQALDGVNKTTPAGVSDMKKFVSIIKENSTVKEAVFNSFEDGTVGGDANSFLLAADEINDLVMAQVDKIKINADESLLRDMMDKFNAFMTSYHTVGKDILQPDLFNDSIGESVVEGSSPKEKQKTPYRDINSPEYRAAADKQKQQMAKDKAAEPGKKLANKIAKKDVAEGLSFKDYAALAEAKKKITANEDPCWKGYKMVGTKKKGGKEVPNCVPGTKGD